MGKRKGPVYHNPPSEAPKSMRQAVFAGVALFIVLTVAGMSYSLFSNNTGPVSPKSTTSTVGADSFRPIVPKNPPANARESAAVESATTLVSHGSAASISVRTLPGSKCTIKILYNNTPAIEPGLGAQVADNFGSATWNWTVGPDAPLGMWPANITCSYQGKTAVVQANIEVSSSS